VGESHGREDTGIREVTGVFRLRGQKKVSDTDLHRQKSFQGGMLDQNDVFLKMIECREKVEKVQPAVSKNGSGVGMTNCIRTY